MDMAGKQKIRKDDATIDLRLEWNQIDPYVDFQLLVCKCPGA